MTERSTPQALTEAYRAGRVGVRWPIAPALAASAGIRARERSARALLDQPIEAKADANGSLTPDAMAALVAAATRHLLREPLAGDGIELGAGIGVLAAVVAAQPAVRSVIAVEICETFALRTIPEVARAVLGVDDAKVVPVWGSFDELALDDGCLDFAVEIGSLHHADSLEHTVAECARVLKPGGRLVCFDRAHHDGLPDWLRERMLDHVYDDEWIARNGYPPGIVLTRRENGEHEIRTREWRLAFEAAGLRLEASALFTPRVDPHTAAKGAVSLLPAPIRSRIVSLPVAPRYFAAWCLTRLRPGREAAAGVVFAPATCTGFVARKPDHAR